MRKISKTGVIILGGDTCTGLEPVRSLGKKGIPVTVVDTKPKSISFYSKFVKDCYYISPKNSNIVSSLIKLSEKKKNWVIIPTTDFFVTLVSKNFDELSKHFRLTTPEWDVIKYCIDKNLTHQIASKIGIATPKTFCPKNEEEVIEIINNLDFDNTQWILKSRSNVLFPKKSGGILYKKKALDFEYKSKKHLLKTYLTNLKNTGEYLLIQEKIPGLPDRNFNVRAVMDIESNPVVVCTDRKIRQHPLFFGVGTYRESVNEPELAMIGLKFLKEIGYRGMAYLEFKEDLNDGKMKLIEVNPRLGMGVSLSKASGVDLSYALYNSALKMPYINNNSFKNGIRWIYLRNDFLTILKNKKNLPWARTFIDLVTNCHKTKAFAYLSAEDFNPFVMSIIKK